MGCVRKRGKSWNAQVRISGWRSFTKTFKTKLDATEWVINFEKEVRSKPIPEKDIKSLKLKDLFNRYKVEILPKLKSYKFNKKTFRTILCRQKINSQRWYY